MIFTKADVAITILGPAILGAVLGVVIYRAVVPDTQPSLMLVVFIIAGMLLVSAAAYVFRRLVVPKDKKDETV